MPIPIKVRDNTSTVRVKPIDEADKVKVCPGGDAEGRFLNEKINKEIADRIAGDEQLQITKQDKIEFIVIAGSSLIGVLPPEDLLALQSYVNKIIVGNAVYRLSVVEGNIRHYFTSNELTEFNEITVNMETGEYEIVNKMNPIIQQHIEDTVIHITEEERLYWNNKVSANVELNQGFDSDYNLLLEK